MLALISTTAYYGSKWYEIAIISYRPVRFRHEPLCLTNKNFTIMTLLRILMNVREEHQNKLREFQNGGTVTFDRDQWLYMLNHGQANRDECEVMWQNAESIRVRKISKPMHLEPSDKVRTMRFNPVTGLMECVWEGTASEWRKRPKKRYRANSTGRV